MILLRLVPLARLSSNQVLEAFREDLVLETAYSGLCGLICDNPRAAANESQLIFLSYSSQVCHSGASSS
jgi:hypothetical protein